MKFSAVIVAAGSGSRAGPGQAKQWRLLAGRPLLRWSVEALYAAGAEQVVVVVPAGDEPVAAEVLAGLEGWRAVAGGVVRAQSVQSGLDALTDRPDGEAVLV